jgi:hypothetical protein
MRQRPGHIRGGIGPLRYDEVATSGTHDHPRDAFMKHVEKAAPLAAAASALATLACCFPVGIAAAAATTSLGVVVSAHRGWFLGASAALLALGIVQAVRVRRACATRNRASQLILGASATIVLLVIFFPQIVAAIVADWLP